MWLLIAKYFLTRFDDSLFDYIIYWWSIFHLIVLNILLALVATKICSPPPKEFASIGFLDFIGMNLLLLLPVVTMNIRTVFDLVTMGDGRSKFSSFIIICLSICFNLAASYATYLEIFPTLTRFIHPSLSCNSI